MIGPGGFGQAPNTGVGRGLAEVNYLELKHKFEVEFTTLEQVADYSAYGGWIGKKVRKKRKPFKSGDKVNTVRGIVPHPYRSGAAFTFYEDASVVSCSKCYLVGDCDDGAC